MLGAGVGHRNERVVLSGVGRGREPVERERPGVGPARLVVLFEQRAAVVGRDLLGEQLDPPSL